MVFNEITRKVDLVAFFFLSPQVRKLGDIKRSHVEKWFSKILRFEFLKYYL